MSAPRDGVIGAGIVGLAMAYALARRGRRVTVFDTTRTPEGASVRNFGTLWPIGQPAGPRRRLALESLAIWRDVLDAAGCWWAPCGSLHLAYHDDELQLISEFAAAASTEQFACRVIAPAEAIRCQPRIQSDGLLGALASPHEMQVNSRQALSRIPEWLTHRWGVTFETGARVTACGGGVIRAGGRSWPVEHAWLAPGDDVWTLYPEAFAASGVKRCKLQMMRTAPVSWLLGPILAAGLTLTHYESFAACPSFRSLRARVERDWPDHIAHGVHVLVAQHDERHLILGDSHQYDDEISPFDRPDIDDLVLRYLATFLETGPLRIVERWHGTYLKHPREPYRVWDPEAGVTAVTALGGHGMTMSFGLAEQVVRQRLDTGDAGTVTETTWREPSSLA